MTSGATITLQPQYAPSRLPDNGKRFFIWTIGCQMNEADSAKVAAMLQEAGYRATDEEERRRYRRVELLCRPPGRRRQGLRAS